MGGTLDDFRTASQSDFQVVLDAYKISSGYKEPDDDITSTDDFDDLYAGLADNMKERPEDWQQ